MSYRDDLEAAAARASAAERELGRVKAEAGDQATRLASVEEELAAARAELEKLKAAEKQVAGKQAAAPAAAAAAAAPAPVKSEPAPASRDRRSALQRHPWLIAVVLGGQVLVVVIIVAATNAARKAPLEDAREQWKWGRPVAVKSTLPARFDPVEQAESVRQIVLRWHPPDTRLTLIRATVDPDGLTAGAHYAFASASAAKDIWCLHVDVYPGGLSVMPPRAPGEACWGQVEPRCTTAELWTRARAADTAPAPDKPAQITIQDYSNDDLPARWNFTQHDAPGAPGQDWFQRDIENDCRK